MGIVYTVPRSIQRAFVAIKRVIPAVPQSAGEYVIVVFTRMAPSARGLGPSKHREARRLRPAGATGSPFLAWSSCPACLLHELVQTRLTFP